MRSRTLSEELTEVWLDFCTLQLTPNRASSPNAAARAFRNRPLEAREEGAQLRGLFGELEELSVDVLVHRLVGIVYLFIDSCMS